MVGFNVRRFDYQVLRGYTERISRALPTFDLLDAIRDRIGFRLPLGHLAEENLGVAKGADGLQSLRVVEGGPHRRDRALLPARRRARCATSSSTRRRAAAPALPHERRRARADSDAVAES